LIIVGPPEPCVEKAGHRVDYTTMFGKDCVMDMISGLRYAAAQKKAEEEAAAKAKAKADAEAAGTDDDPPADEPPSSNA
jgi:hypothetical protein